MTESNTVGQSMEVTDPQTSIPTRVPRKEINVPSIGSSKVEMLTDENWFSWREKIESLLHCHEVHGHIDGSDPRPTTDQGDIKMWEKEDYIARTIILVNLVGEKVAHVSRAKTVKEAWENLKTVHETRSQSSALIAKHTFYSMQAEENRNISDHVTDMTKR
jgi:hypothetical protein